MEPRSIYSMQINEYGRIIVKLKKVMDSKEVTRNRLKDLTHTKYDVVDRYYRGKDIRMADLDFLARVCYVLDCRVDDLLEYCNDDGETDPCSD